MRNNIPMERTFSKGKKFGFGGGRGGDRGGRGGFGGGRSRGFDRDGGRPEMHEATCGDCGNSCEVPFKPTGNRPVFCNNCFRQEGNVSRPERFSDRAPRFDRAERSDRREPGAFGDVRNGNKSVEQLQVQVQKMNDKIDAILAILNKSAE